MRSTERTLNLAPMRVGVRVCDSVLAPYAMIDVKRVEHEKPKSRSEKFRFTMKGLSIGEA